METKFTRYVCLGFLIIAFILSSVSFAHAEIKMIKPFKGSLGIGEGLTYNTNPGFSSRRDRYHDWANRMDADLSLQLPFGKVHRLSAELLSAWYQYFHYNKFSRVDLSMSDSLDLSFNRWTLNIHHNLNISGDPTVKETIDLTKGVFKKTVNQVGVTAKGGMGKLELEGGFDTNFYRVNDLYRILDRDSYSTYIDGAYEITPLFAGFTRFTYKYTKRQSAIMNSYNQYDVQSGIRGELTPYLAGEFGVGYDVMSLAEASVNSDESVYSGITYGGTLTNRLGRLTSQKLTLSYEPEPGYEEGGNYYRSCTLEYTATHRLNRFMNLNGLFEWSSSKESGTYPAENANTWKCGGGVDFVIAKNINLRTDYQYTQKNSSRHGKGYRQQALSVGLNNKF